LLTGDVEERVFQLLEQKKQLELEKKNLLELVKVQIAQSDEVFWKNLPLDMQSMKQIAAYCNEKDKDIVLVNQEGYFAMEDRMLTCTLRRSGRKVPVVVEKE